MLQSIKNSFYFFIFSNLFVAFCALALFFSSEIILESKNYQIGVFIFFSTIFTYNFQRIVRIKKGVKHVRRCWLEDNKKAIAFLITISGLISFYQLLFFNISTQITIIICGIISLLYPFGIRKIPFLKIFIISIVWTTATFLLLVFENHIVMDFSILIHFFIRFFFVLAITIPFDIRDLSFDAAELKTIPVLFGEANARLLAILFLILSQVMCIYLLVFQLLELNYFLALLTSFFITSILILKSTSKKSEIYFSFGVESTSVIFYLILAISSCMV